MHVSRSPSRMMLMGVGCPDPLVGQRALKIIQSPVTGFPANAMTMIPRTQTRG
jgi:hypothetical protein